MSITTKEYLELKRKNPNPYSKSSYHEHYDGEQEDYEKIIEYNRALTDKYPWLIPTNTFSGVRITTTEPGFYGGCDDIPSYDYSYTELDQMPDGWRIAFGEQMCEEIHQELVKFDCVDKYRILQIKEKFGGLRWYDDGVPIGNKELFGELYILPNNTLSEVGDDEYYDYIKTLDDGTKVYKHYIIKDRCKIRKIIEKYRDLSYQTCINCGEPARWVSQGWICPYCPDCKKNILKRTGRKETFKRIKINKKE